MAEESIVTVKIELDTTEAQEQLAQLSEQVATLTTQVEKLSTALAKAGGPLEVNHQVVLTAKGSDLVGVLNLVTTRQGRTV